MELEDLVQETFADVLRGLDGIRHDTEGLFLNWLARCVENNIRDQLRRGQALKRGAGRVRAFASLGEDSLSESLFAGREDSPSEVVRGRELEERLEQGMLALGARYREVLSLRIHGGLSFREIAEVMELPSENTANVLFARAREKLRRLVM
ncbi:MAG: sigma-70 family RNA polymerase sigma factor [Planctomycetota bacterium]